jgi:hypothetical protein
VGEVEPGAQELGLSPLPAPWRSDEDQSHDTPAAHPVLAAGRRASLSLARLPYPFIVGNACANRKMTR